MKFETCDFGIVVISRRKDEKMMWKTINVTKFQQIHKSTFEQMHFSFYGGECYRADGDSMTMRSIEMHGYVI